MGQKGGAGADGHPGRVWRGGREAFGVFRTGISPKMTGSEADVYKITEVGCLEHAVSLHLAILGKRIRNRKVTGFPLKGLRKWSLFQAAVMLGTAQSQ